MMFPQGLYNMLGMPGFDDEYDSFNKRAEFRQVFAWRPRQCFITKQWLWFRTITKGTAVCFGPGTPVEETRYYDSAEYLLLKLKYGV